MTMKPAKQSTTVRTIAVVGMLAALSYVCFTFFQIKIPLGGGDYTSLHLGNMVPVLGALLFGGLWGGLGGAIGMTIGDLFDPVYVIYAPRTFVLKFCIGLICGFVAHKLLHLRSQSGSKRVVATVVSAASGLAFNAIVEPIIKYVYNLLILGKPAAELSISWNIISCTTNAVVSCIAATLLYLALQPALQKAGLLPEKA